MTAPTYFKITGLIKKDKAYQKLNIHTNPELSTQLWLLLPGEL